MIEGLIKAIIAMLFGHSSEQKMLKNCLVDNDVMGVEIFHYKGKLYDRNKYIKLKVNELYNNDHLDKKTLIKHLKQTESELKDYKYPELLYAEIDAYKIAINNYEKKVWI